MSSSGNSLKRSRYFAVLRRQRKCIVLDQSFFKYGSQTNVPARFSRSLPLACHEDYGKCGAEFMCINIGLRVLCIGSYVLNGFLPSWCLGQEIAYRILHLNWSCIKSVSSRHEISKSSMVVRMEKPKT
jgi:hypothetical protein